MAFGHHTKVTRSATQRKLSRTSGVASASATESDSRKEDATLAYSQFSLSHADFVAKILFRVTRRLAQIQLFLASRIYNLTSTDTRRSTHMAAFDDVVIISGCRTPVGKFQGSLSDFTAPQIGAVVVREAVKRANLDPTTNGRMHHGQRALRRTRAESRAPGCHLRRSRS